MKMKLRNHKQRQTKHFANVWMHAGFLQIEKEKMSKSLGNFVTIRDVLQDHEPEVLRYFLISQSLSQSIDLYD